MKETRYEKDVYFDLFKDKADDFDMEDYYLDKIDREMLADTLDDIVINEDIDEQYFEV